MRSRAPARFESHARRGIASSIVLIAAACTPTVEPQASTTDPSSWGPEGAPAQPTATSTAVGLDKPMRWEHADRLSAFRKAAPRVRSQHLGGEHDAEVLVNDVAATYPTLGPLRPIDVGSVLVEALYAPNQSDIDVYFAMVKQPSATGGTWEFLVVSKNGWVERRGALPLCARCHAEAPFDHVFGRAR